MSILTIIVIAFGLAMDAFAVSITSGAVYREPKINHALRVALAFGGFQAIMPLIGWFAGMSLRGYIKDYGHWAAFGLLFIIGVKMIYESFKIGQSRKRPDALNISMILILAIATSIDALAVGIAFSFLLAGSLSVAVIVIGGVTFVLSYIGFHIGRKLGHFFETGIEAFGGIILIAIGLKILLEHLLA